MAKKTKVHDTLFKDVYVDKGFVLDIFRLVMAPKEFQLFNWKTVKPEATFHVDAEGSPRQADLTFSVKMKNSRQTADIVLLLEHKSYPDNKVLQQLLEYQAAMYAKRKNPIVPILVYQGPQKEWKHPLGSRKPWGKCPRPQASALARTFSTSLAACSTCKS